MNEQPITYTEAAERYIDWCQENDIEAGQPIHSASVCSVNGVLLNDESGTLAYVDSSFSVHNLRDPADLTAKMDNLTTELFGLAYVEDRLTGETSLHVDLDQADVVWCYICATCHVAGRGEDIELAHRIADLLAERVTE